MNADPLAAVLIAGVAWLEGVRRLPADARALHWRGRAWELARPLSLAGDYRLVTWSVALWPSVALQSPEARPAAEVRRGAARLRVRRRRVSLALGALRAACAMLLALLVLGIPTAIGRWRTWGLLGALAGALLLSALVALIVVIALRRIAVPWGASLRAAAPMLWPFSALRGAETVLAHATRGVPDAAVMRELVGEARLLEACRRELYDVRHGRAPAPDALVRAEALAAALPPATVVEYLDAAPRGWGPAEGAYCPRCAAHYVAGAAACAECDGAVALRLAAAR
ncbi:MAG: hypothetical protein ACJ8AO_08305 [Gemmatimonadaceae bacterium]